MNCREVQVLLHAYLDGELDLAHSLALERHLQTCSTCQSEYQSYQVLTTALKEHSMYFRAPPTLRKRIYRALPQSAPRHAQRASLIRLSVAGLLLFLLGGLAFWGLSSSLFHSTEDNHMAQAVIDSHERSLINNHLVDLSSSDPNLLKGWFESKLGFSPPVADLTPQRYILIGGRVDVLDNCAVAAIVYKSGSHIITLFAWPASRPAEHQTFFLQGYSLTHWSTSGMDCWVVADLNEEQMQRFARLIDQHQVFAAVKQH